MSDADISDYDVRFDLKFPQVAIRSYQNGCVKSIPLSVTGKIKLEITNVFEVAPLYLC